jgi:hypothetical protein
MKTILSPAAFGAIALLGATLQSPAPAGAGAPIYPWCMQPSARWGPDCYYSTIEQCRATAAGVGYCYQNPRYMVATQGKPEGKPERFRR